LHYLWYAGRAIRTRDADGLWVFQRT
jgi:hypothetical protein